MDKIITEREDGIDIAFERVKAWSKYCKELLSYVSRRTHLELEHAKRIQTLANQSKLTVTEQFLPLKNVFENNFDSDISFCEHTFETIKYIQDRFIKSLEMRRDDHERQRRALKNEWLRVTKQVKDTQQELIRARTLLESRDDGYRRAQESFLRTESTGPAVGSELLRRKKELEKRRKNEEDAFSKREEAQTQVEKLELELDQRQLQVEEAKIRIVGQLRELIYRCDQTTKACSTHYFQALANLWVSQPSKYHEFADATRTYIPGTEYMSFLQHLPRRTASSGSLFRVENGDVSLISVSLQRRNAIDVSDGEILPERRQKKSSSGRLIDQSILECAFATEAARSHRLQKIRQPTKCSQCETLSILSTVQCSECGLIWHKSCITRITVFCGQKSKESVDSSPRRISIFGIALSMHLNSQSKRIPQILVRCVEELEKRGLKVKGIYRTCGVKSKIEQICEEFERSAESYDVDLDSYHPMNIASVVKLYLRKLPEPLFTYELYGEWITLANRCSNEETLCFINELKYLLEKLPEKNLDTLEFLLLHLNRVTWFELENLMTASNLGAVISPSLIWMPSFNSDASLLNEAHLMSKVVEMLIKHAFEIFGVDRADDWQRFFQKHVEIEEPLLADAEMEARLEQSDVLDVEDLLEDDNDTLCSSFSPQPPTPDLLKNTSRNKFSSCTASDDADIDNFLESVNCSNKVDNGILLDAPSSSFIKQSSLELVEKKRSYTTSILVSPSPSRKCEIPQRQRSMDEKKFYHLCSGDVTVNVGKAQFFVQNDKKSSNSSNRVAGIFRRLSQGAYDMQSCDRPMSGQKIDTDDIHSVGVIFSSGSDVSYI
ncbi:unnamed protein product [Dracunculus medinensis]|uniref:Rho-GAP domain-containing protein n=1 Tax=Dracunculus medinensis TaxID=318479 RepID=A0A158Q4R9_DRAME|nr:unnamed protein product [Dracunculus medinensis]